MSRSTILENKVKCATPLGEGVSLEVRRDDGPVFSSNGKWLYPLFELEVFLERSGLNPVSLFLHDRIGGRAAASLICRMGFRSCSIDTVSRPALEVFERHGVNCTFNQLVDRILCRTEDLISHDMDIDHVYGLLKKRAGLILGVGLEIRELSAGFPEKPVLKGLSLKMTAGEGVIVTGEPAAGKSTLLNAILGRLRSSAGEIRIGEQISSCRRKRGMIGFVKPALSGYFLPLSAREVVAAGCAVDEPNEERAYEIEIAMRRTGCFGLKDESISSLSGAEVLRVSLARCLAQKAGLILLDDPISSLDAGSRKEFLKVLASVSRNEMPTMILVSRDHEAVKGLGWQVHELKDGRLG